MWLAPLALLLAPVLALALALMLVLVPGQQPPAVPGGMVCSTGAGPDGSVAGYRGAQLSNAAAIVGAAQQRGLPPTASVIAVAVAMQESTLRNLVHGDTAGPDSRGLFQQRASWGPEQIRRDPAGAAGLFFNRLTALSDPPWDADPRLDSPNNPAQRVQSSARPLAYAQHEQAARQVVGNVLGVRCPPPGAGSPAGQAAVDRASSQVGVPYAWGGGTASGPSAGTGPDAGVTGYDCSGLAVYAYAEQGVSVPHQTQAIWQRFGPPIRDRSQLQPGDLVLLSDDGTPRGIHHVGIYRGGEQMVEAPQSGQPVRIRDHVWSPSSNYTREFVGAVRPGGLGGRG